MKIMTRVNSPYPQEEAQKAEDKQTEVASKYALKPPRDLRSKFLIAMEQREIEKKLAEQQRLEDERKREMEELEKPPLDDLYGLRVHSWIFLRAGEKEVEESLFIEPSTGANHPLNSPLYCGIESLWNHENYWVNMQDCSGGLGSLSYDLTDVSKWEHFLPGEPLRWRQKKVGDLVGDEEEAGMEDVMDEKHLDMPLSWSMKISIPHEVLANRYPNGKKTTYFKRTLVEEFAPYVQEDGLVTRISRFEDLECAGSPYVIEQIYANRRDCMIKIVYDCPTNNITEYFKPGRDDAAKEHTYNADNDELQADRTVKFYAKARHDGLSTLDISSIHICENYEDREDLIYYRKIEYAKRGEPPPGMIEGNRRIVVRVTEKFNRNVTKPANADIAVREFSTIDREIHLKYHYNTDRVTASTRDFIKPPVAEMGDRMRFKPELTCGYESELGAKPPRQLQLYLMFEQQLTDEEKALAHVREVEDLIEDFLIMRQKERVANKLNVSLFCLEQHQDDMEAMLERERQVKERRVKEVEDEIDYIAPYMARLGGPTVLTAQQAKIVIEQCLEEFKQMLVDRANDIQRQFEMNTILLQDRQAWYATVQDTMKPEEEEVYFEEIHRIMLLLSTLEIRLERHKDLSPHRYVAMQNYLAMEPRLAPIYKTK